MASASTDNLREFTVSELSGAVRRAIEEGFSYVRVRGELGAVKRHASGHIYVDLKDENACIAGVIWRSAAARLSAPVEQGMEVVATGRLTTYAQQSKYQIVIDSLQPAGAGALMALFEERKKKLAAEGLFEAARKRPIPFLPEVIGVVTSPSGAVIRDILHRLRDRFPRRVIVWPTPVQGRGAELSIAAAIRGFNELAAGGDIPRPDVLIVARGGGSLEDLWCFNEEVVVRAAAASAIPLISAVGHETDTTLIDLAADLRAPTPTAAAEKCVPMRAELIAETMNKHRRMISAMSRRFEETRVRIVAAARGLGRPEDFIGAKAQELDRKSDRLAAALRRRSDRAATRLTAVAARFGRRAFDLVIERKARRVDACVQRLSRARLSALFIDRRRALARERDRLAAARRRLFDRPRERLNAAVNLMRSLSYKSVLERGFALVRKADGALARRASDLPRQGTVALLFADGERVAALSAAPDKRRAGRREDQKSLFD
jgi:exodeoxyribonuclease VII large subunit